MNTTLKASSAPVNLVEHVSEKTIEWRVGGFLLGSVHKFDDADNPRLIVGIIGYPTEQRPLSPGSWEESTKAARAECQEIFESLCLVE